MKKKMLRVNRSWQWQNDLTDRIYDYQMPKEIVITWLQYKSTSKQTNNVFLEAYSEILTVKIGSRLMQFSLNFICFQQTKLLLKL